jgi:Uma2 family endonuclease
MTLAHAISPSTVSPVHMTEAQFVEWVSEEQRVEWVAGEVVFKMPITELHDLLQRAIAASLEALVRRKALGHVRGDRFTMRLPQKPSRREADVIFIAKANQGRLAKTQLDGPADLAIEIVSEDSSARDYREKYLEYEAAGVREYWIVDPLAKVIEAHRLSETGKYEPLKVDAEGKLASVLIPDFWLSAAALFKEQTPDALELMQLLKIV